MWNPQHYREMGARNGVASEVVEAAIAQSEVVIRHRPSLPSILTLKHLSIRAQVDFGILRAIVERSQNNYRSFLIRKRAGGWRRINVPSPILMRVQKWIAIHILNLMSVHRDSFAFAPGSSIADCASRHTGAKWLVKMDVSDFFGSINELQVFRIFRAIGYQPLVSFELARICTCLPAKSRRYSHRSWVVWKKHEVISSYRQKHLGRLPQGAPTSPMLSNLFMIELDSALASVASDMGLVYTRYSDDITFSTRAVFDRARALDVVARATTVLRKAGLSPNNKKTSIVPPGGRKIVLGLLVDGAKPRLPREFKNRLRQHLHFMETKGPFQHASAREFESVGGLYRHVRGLIDYAAMVEPDHGLAMLRRLEAVDWTGNGNS